MVMTFSAMPDVSVMIKGPMKSGWILFAFRVLFKRTKSLMARWPVRAFRSKYSLLTTAAVSRESTAAQGEQDCLMKSLSSISWIWWRTIILCSIAAR
uniref:Uncharacterized protein n=1 Tax=Romanomermis culicivorax TaxID=13658 RepID=A0A915J2D2_ROMCU